MNIMNIKKGNDPFKKYWWVILLGFAGVGAWVCMPLMDTSVGSGSVHKHGLESKNQSLDSMANPSGAPGSAYDLSMDGAYGKKKADGEPSSSLYQAPPESEPGAVAPGAPLAPGASASFADALKEVSAKTAAASWGGAKPQVAFTPPKGNFSSLSGTGSSTSGSGASYSPPAIGAFGTSNAQTGMTTTRGLGSALGAGGPGATPIMSALKGAASQGQAAQMNKSADASHAIAGGAFDGRGNGSAIGGGPSTSLGGTYLGMDSMPANLKPNDPNANDYKVDAPPPAFAAQMSQSQQMQQAIMMMVVSAVVGGVVTGMVGSIFGTGAMAGAGGGGAQAAQMYCSQNPAACASFISK
jgi:hypothetical protein